MLRLRPSSLAFALAAAGAAAGAFSFSQGPAPVKAERAFKFEINNNRVKPGNEFAAKVTAVGSAITDNGDYHMPVTMSVEIADDSHDVFGSRMNAWHGNVNDHQPARHAIIDEVYTAGQAIDITAYSWYKHDNDFAIHMSVSSADGSPNVIALRNGEPVPAIPAFDDQTEIADFLVGYIDPDTNTIRIADDQIIYLFELGVTDLTSAAADFQDLIVLVTLGRTPDDLRVRDLIGYD